MKRDFSGTLALRDVLKDSDIIKVLQPQRFPSHSNAPASSGSKITSEAGRKVDDNRLIVKAKEADRLMPTDSGFNSFMIPSNSELLKPPSVNFNDDQQNHESGIFLNKQIKMAQKNFLRPKEVTTKDPEIMVNNNLPQINSGSFLRNSNTNTLGRSREIDDILEYD